MRTISILEILISKKWLKTSCINYLLKANFVGVNRVSNPKRVENKNSYFLHQTRPKLGFLIQEQFIVTIFNT